MVPSPADSTLSPLQILAAIVAYGGALIFVAALIYFDKWTQAKNAARRKVFSKLNQDLKRRIVLETAAADHDGFGRSWWRNTAFCLGFIALGTLIASQYWERLGGLGEILFCLAMISFCFEGAWDLLATQRRLEALPLPASYIRPKKIATMTVLPLLVALVCYFLAVLRPDFPFTPTFHYQPGSSLDRNGPNRPAEKPRVTSPGRSAMPHG